MICQPNAATTALIESIAAAAPIAGYAMSMDEHGDATEISGQYAATATDAEKAAAAALLDEYFSAAARLARAKRRRMGEIDARVGTLLARGFVWREQRLSLSDAAQRNAKVLADLTDGQFAAMAAIAPVRVSTLDGGAYELAALTDARDYAAAMLAHLFGILQTNIDLRLQVSALDTIQAVEAWIDPRS